MSLSDNKVTTITFKHKNQQDRPNASFASATAFKQAMDSPAEQLQAGLNGVIDVLVSMKTGESGADNIGSSALPGIPPGSLHDHLVALKVLFDSSDAGTIGTALINHIADKANPHAVTADQVGAVKKSGDTMTGDLIVNGVKVGRGAGNNSLNTVVGNSALNANTTGQRNIAIGLNALTTDTTGSFNIAIGVNALATSNSDNNTAIGSGSGAALSSGASSTFVGQDAGGAVATGSNNTIIGRILGTSSLADTVLIGAGSIERLKIVAGQMQINGSISIRHGSGSPEGVVAGGVGDLFLRTDGGTTTTFYVKESGTGNTGWKAK